MNEWRSDYEYTITRGSTCNEMELFKINRLLHLRLD